jgi:hypothetical protein
MDTTIRRRSVRTWLVCAVLLVVALGAIGAVSGQQSAPSPAITITVDADGNATWTVTNTIALSSSAEEDAFDRLANNRSQRQELLAQNVSPYRPVAQQASQQLNRTMSVEPESISFDRVGNTGIINVSFRWNRFASTDGETVRVGDVFAGGFQVSEGRMVTIAGPDNYRLVSNNVSTDAATVDDTSVTWQGPAELTDENTLVFGVSTPTPTTTPTPTDTPTSVTDGSGPSTATGTATPAEPTTPGDGGPGFGFLLGLVSVALALIVARHG